MTSIQYHICEIYPNSCIMDSLFFKRLLLLSHEYTMVLSFHYLVHTSRLQFCSITNNGAIKICTCILMWMHISFLQPSRGLYIAGFYSKYVTILLYKWLNLLHSNVQAQQFCLFSVLANTWNCGSFQ